MPKFATLTNSYALRGWSSLPKALVNVETGALFPLPDAVDYVMNSCDGKTDFDSLLFLPRHLGILEALEQQGMVTVSDQPSQLLDYQARRGADVPLITNVHWAITGRCNLHCRHCYMDAPIRRSPEPDWQTVEKIIGEFVTANVPAVTLTGGEPFLRLDIFDILALLKDRQIAVRGLFTNGLLVNARTLTRLEAIGIRPEFNLSFDGVGWHDRMRGTPNIEQAVIETIQLLKDHGYIVAVSTCVDRESAPDLMATYELMKRLDVELWRVMTPYASGAWSRNGIPPMTLDEELAHYQPVLTRWVADRFPMVMQLGTLFDGRTQSLHDYKPPRSFSITPESPACATSAFGAYLTPEGKLLPCLAYTDTPLHAAMPSIHTRGFAAAYRDTRLRDICDLTRQELFSDNPECATCEHFRECGSGCRAMAYRESGRVTACHRQMWEPF